MTCKRRSTRKPPTTAHWPLIDLDHFKAVNDALGHAVGDEVLRSIASRLVAAAPAGTQIAHFGGDEFALVLHSIDGLNGSAEENVRQLVLHIMASIVAPLRLGDHELVVGASAGIALFSNASGAASDVLRPVDVALHRAKASARHTAVVFESLMQEDTDRHHSLETDLRLALKRHEFELHYQPQVDMGGCFVGAEALLCWHHPARGLVGPAEFIPVAEESGLIHAIGREVLHLACNERSGWPSSLAHARLSVNISPWQLFAEDFVSTLLETVHSTKANPEQITLEITENMYLHDLDDIASKIRTLDALGFHFSLDDFGSGYTSLASLKKLPVREFKIDRAFVEGLQPGSRDGFVEAMIAIAHHLDLVVVAEGVETKAQHAALCAMGCDVTQGYLVSRPLSATQFRSWLAANAA
ncbi:MAG: bifunctional diguanylate cyclase/phosphodiesterase [Dokdonella sp.]